MRVKRCGIQAHGLVMSQVHELEADWGWIGPRNCTEDAVALAKAGGVPVRGPGPSGGVLIHTEQTWPQKFIRAL